jgi:hypothetical protein
VRHVRGERKTVARVREITGRTCDRKGQEHTCRTDMHTCGTDRPHV